MGWELFQQYVRALREAKPRFFIYENNKSMSKAIRASIDDAFGFEAVEINSALVSAQNRQRLYWVGRRNADGTYSRVYVEQPEDRGILLRDILETASLKPLSENEMDYMVRDHQDRRWNFCNKPGQECKSRCLTANVHKGVPYNAVADPVRIPPYGNENKSRPVCATYPSHAGAGDGSLEQRMFSDNPSKEQVDLVAEPIGIGYRGRINNGQWKKQYEAREDLKANSLTTAQTDSMVAEQVGATPRPDGELSTSAGKRVYSVDAKGRYLCANGGGEGAKTGLYAVPVDTEYRKCTERVGNFPTEDGRIVDHQDNRIYSIFGGW